MDVLQIRPAIQIVSVVIKRGEVTAQFVSLLLKSGLHTCFEIIHLSSDVLEVGRGRGKIVPTELSLSTTYQLEK
jgi:hypothetical protein